MHLEARDLEIERGENLLFSGLSFQLQEGEILQIEGHNGSGKTTLLRMLCGLVLPTGGDIYWNDKPIRKVRSDYFAELTYVGHHSGVKGELTAGETLNMDRALGRARPNIELDEALDELAMGDYEDAYGRTLSAGQRRRVALARLFATEGRLWVLDEPFTALDRSTRANVEALLRQHVQNGGMVILTTHHDMQLDGCCIKNLVLGE